MDLGYTVAGLAVGFIVGLTGVGGGSLMTPILLWFGISPATAVGTDLLYAALTKAGGVAAHHGSATSTGASRCTWRWAACRRRC